METIGELLLSSLDMSSGEGCISSSWIMALVDAFKSGLSFLGLGADFVAFEEEDMFGSSGGESSEDRRVFLVG